MSVKSTRTLSRQDAEERYVELRIEPVVQQIRAAIRVEAASKSDQDLEDDLERLNDAAHAGEGFENYLIQAA